jgi:hypothetical protein
MMSDYANSFPDDVRMFAGLSGITTDYCFCSLVPLMFLYSNGDVLAGLRYTLPKVTGVTRASRGHKWINKTHGLHASIQVKFMEQYQLLMKVHIIPNHIQQNDYHAWSNKHNQQLT